MREPHGQMLRVFPLESVDNQLKPDQKHLFNAWIERLPYNKNVYEQIGHLRVLEKEVKALEKGIPGDSLRTRLRYFFKTTAGRIAFVLIVVLISADVYFVVRLFSSSDKTEKTSPKCPPKGGDFGVR
jgi:hypothetical protein